MSDEELHRLLLTRLESQARDIHDIRESLQDLPDIRRDAREASEHAREGKELWREANGRLRTIEKWRERVEGRREARGETGQRAHAWQVALLSALVSGGIGGLIWTVIDLIPHR